MISTPAAACAAPCAGLLPAPRLSKFSRPLPLAAQELFELRKKVKTRQDVKSHLFVHTKHRIAQLQSLLTQRQL